MGRAPSRAHLARPRFLAAQISHAAGARLLAAPLVAGLILLSAAPAAVAAGWTKPGSITPPMPLDPSPSQIASSPDGEVAIATTFQNPDKPWISDPIFTLITRKGRVGPVHKIPGVSQVLAVGFAGQTLELLTGSSPRGQRCCAAIQIVTFIRGGFSARTVLRGLLSGEVGHLTKYDDRGLIASVANGQGVWAGATDGTMRRLTPPGTIAETLSATTLRNGAPAIAWTATRRPPPYGSPESIDLALGSARRAPTGGRRALRLSSGHQIDELSLAPGRSGPTAAWTETWFDGAGYHSQVAVADIPRDQIRELPVAGTFASLPSLAGDGKGDEVLTWRTCDSVNLCSAEAVIRRRSRRFSDPVALGTIDPSQGPVAAISRGGQAIVGWIDHGHVFAAVHKATASKFSAAHEISATRLAAQLTIAFTSDIVAVASWTQGTTSPMLMAARYSVR